MLAGPTPLPSTYGICSDGRSIIVAKQDTGSNKQHRIVAQRFDWHPRDLADKICERLPDNERDLTPDERRRYMSGEPYRFDVCSTAQQRHTR
jgi:hypothetical protein